MIRRRWLNRAAQLKLRVWSIAPPARLLLIDDSLVNFRHCRHTLPDYAGEIVNSILPRRITFHRALQDAQFPFRNRQPVCLLSLSQLQPVLQMPQELIRAGEIMELLTADVALIMQLLE